MIKIGKRRFTAGLLAPVLVLARMHACVAQEKQLCDPASVQHVPCGSTLRRFGERDAALLQSRSTAVGSATSLLANHPLSHRPLPPSPPPPLQQTITTQTYDVWNEVLHYRDYIDKCNLWNDTLADAFRWAHDADPAAELCINE